MNPAIRFAVVPLLICMVAGVVGPLPSQVPGASEVPASVDAQGVLRWTDTGDEVALFGVNYSTPFAHAFSAHSSLGVHRKQAIEAHVLHLARLGLDA